MISWFKKNFIPHEGNEHRPHFLRTSNIRNIVVIVLFLELSTFLLPTLLNLNQTGGMAAVLTSVLSDLTNEERKDQNLDILTVNKTLNEAAEMKANDMATYGYFAHTSPQGKTPWYWIEKVGYKYEYAGENLAINFNDSKDVTNAWMESPTHKLNIVKENYTEMGTGIATGIYQGKKTIFVVQIYASPVKSIVVLDKKKVQESVLKKELPSVSSVKNLPVVLGVETENVAPIQKATFLQKIFTSPRDTTNKILFVVFGIIFISLLLNTFIKIKHHHLDLITNVLITLAIIGAIFVTNNYISKHNMIVLESIDYVSQQV
jgi:Cysteine-rich secretory protein family